MNSPAPVTVERRDGLATVTFDSPPLNLFDSALAAGLDAAIVQLESERPRAVLDHVCATCPTALRNAIGVIVHNRAGFSEA